MKKERRSGGRAFARFKYAFQGNKPGNGYAQLLSWHRREAQKPGKRATVGGNGGLKKCLP